MGFYSPQSLVADGRRHHVRTHHPDINASLAHATLEPDPDSADGLAVRLGLAAVRNLGTEAAEQIVAERDTGGPYRDLGELGQRVHLDTPALEALATAGAFTTFGQDRRQTLWTAGAAAR
jgi:error-prone DNA polymerase